MTNELESIDSILNDVYVITGGRFSTSREFSEYISECVYMKSTSYMDEVIEFCQENDIDIEIIKPLVHQTLKEKLYAEAVENNLLKNEVLTGTLPF